MFQSKNKTIYEIKAPLSGTVIPLEQIRDNVFSQKILGSGAAVIPSDNLVLSPVDGTIMQISDTGHLYTIETAEGICILIHIGIGTASLPAGSIKSFVMAGQSVRAGNVLAQADLEKIRSYGIDLCTPVVITGDESVHITECTEGSCTGGETVILQYTQV